MKYLMLLCFVFCCSPQLHAQKFIDQAILTQGGLGKLPSDAGFSIQKPASGISYTGALDFSYNLFPNQLNGQLLSFNISYNSRGVKVDEEASEVGLGWSDNFVGKIVRTVNGYDDFAGGLANGRTIYFNNDMQFVDTVPYPLYQMNFNMKYTLPANKIREINIDGNFEIGSQLYLPFIRLAGESHTVNVNNQFSVNENIINDEFEPDQYYVNVPGFSAEFIIDKRGKIYEKSNSGALYYYTYKIINGEYEVTWKIIAPNGIAYYFNKYETRQSLNAQIPPFSKPISSWYLTQIVTPNGDKIDYTYSARNYIGIKNYTNRNEILTGTAPEVHNLPDIDLKTWVLDSVITRNFKISLARESRKDAESAERITAIKLHRLQQGIPVTDSVHFYQSYFIGTTGYSNGVRPDLGYNAEYLTHRLRLDSLSINIAAAKKEDQVYKFEYNDAVDLPSKNSLSRDLWGYYNASGANSLLPKSYLYFSLPISTIETLGTADRSAGELEEVQKFALKKIVYPTNGYTEIEYENNDYNIRESNKYIFSGLNALDAFPNPRLLETGYPMDAFGSKVRTIDFYVPATDLIAPHSTVNCKVEAVAPVDYNYFNQDPNFQVTFLKIYDSTGTVVFDADPLLRDIVQNSYDPTGKQYIVNGDAHLAPGKYRMEFSFDKNWQFVQGYLLVRINWLRTMATMTDMYKMQRGPGLRVKKIIHKTDPVSVASTSLYNYNYYEPGKDILTGADVMVRSSYGILINKPINFTQKVTRSCSFPNTTTDLQLYSGITPAVTADDLGYTRIEELQIGRSDTLRKVYKYNVIPSTIPDYDGMYISGLKYINYPVNGLLMKESSYLGNTDQLLHTKTYRYQYELTNEIWGVKYFRGDGGTILPEMCMQPGDVMMVFAYPVMSAGYVKKLGEEEKFYQNGQELTKSVDFQYKNYNKNFISSSSYNDSQGRNIIDSIMYVQDFKNTLPVIDTMITRNILSTAIENTKKINGIEVSREKVTYDLWNNKTIVAPLKEEKSVKGAPLEVEATYEAYDQYANPLQFKGRNGIVTSLVWGYNSSYPIAKILGLPYSTIAPFINTGIINNPPNDYILRKEIDKLRTHFPTTHIISSTYLPLIGITSQTSASGNLNYYEYDGQARLKSVRDKDSSIIKLNEYKYSSDVP